MLYVSVLGEQAITDDEAGVHVHSSHAVALVAFLAAHAGAPQPRPRIAGMFWPDSTDAQALTNLRRELHHLRQVLGDERSLVVAPRDLCWRDSQTCRVDLRIFEGERQAALTAAAAGDDAGVLAHAATAYSSPELQRALERSIDLAESLGRKDSTLTGLVALWGTQFVQGCIADGYQTATRALTLVDPDSELSGPAHLAVGGSAVSLGMPAEGLRHLELAAKLASGAVWLSVGTRADVHGTAFAAHAHWLLGHDAEALSAGQAAIELARVIDDPYCLAVALAYGSITHQMRHDMSELRDTVGELRELCGRYGFAYYREWGLILDGWSRPDESGIDLARRGIANLKTAGSFARRPYWLSLLADLLARNGRLGAAQAALDAALIGGRERDDLWWLPEVMRLRAAYDGEEGVISRLRSAAEMAAAHGSVGLLRRCEHDLARRDVRAWSPGVLPAG